MQTSVHEAGNKATNGAVTGAMIAVKQLRKSLRTGASTVEILKGIDFTVEHGEFVAIMGASGSGKSTLLGLLAGLDNPTSGSVSLAGTEISYLPENELAQLRGRTIGFVFQSYQLIPTLTALENVLLPYELNDESGNLKTGLERARTLLESVGLRCAGRSLSRAAFGWRAAARGARTGLHPATAHRARRRTYRQSGFDQWPAHPRTPAAPESGRRHYAGAGHA